MKAKWKNQELANSSRTIEIEGNQYFPPESVNQDFLQESNSHTSCYWKGKASYYNIVIDGSKLSDGAWYYPHPTEKAHEIKDYIAFDKDVLITGE